ncbi:MAG: hypothetical protein AABX38_02515 [Candidatus Micrarchaeota archaeon]
MSSLHTVKCVPMRGERDLITVICKSRLTMLDSVDAFQEKAKSTLRMKHFTNLLLTDVLSQEVKEPSACFDLSKSYRVEGRVGSIYTRGIETIDVGLETDFNQALLVAVSKTGQLSKKISGNVNGPIEIFQNPAGEESFGNDESSIEQLTIKETAEGGIVDRSLTLSCDDYTHKVDITLSSPDIIGFILYSLESKEPGTYNSPYICDSFAVTWPLNSDHLAATQKIEDVIKGIENYARIVQNQWSRITDRF